jgi:hypothetical protein
MSLDTMNRFGVAALGDEFMTLFPVGLMSRADALNLAAWLVAMADVDDEFPALLEAVQNT